MNNPHQNARMTPLGRAEMARRIVEEGRPAGLLPVSWTPR
jgi:hypothetical protein